MRENILINLSGIKKLLKIFCKENDFSLSCAFLKTGSEPLRELNKIKEKGFKILNREDLLTLFKASSSKQATVTDYVEYLQTLDEAHKTYLSIPINKWDDLAWIGFYQYIESKISINTWHYVANPSGGFWNLCLNWKYWDCFPVYSQIEQGKLTFKIALGKDETGLKEGEVNNNNVQDFVHHQLLQFAKEQQFDILERPYPFVHRGNYRTIGVINKETWLGNLNEPVDLQKVIEVLNEVNEFHSSFINHLNKIEYADVL